MRIEIYGQPSCLKCANVRNKLEEKEISHEYIDDIERVRQTAKRNKTRQLPIILIDGIHTPLLKFQGLLRDGKLK